MPGYKTIAKCIRICFVPFIVLFLFFLVKNWQQYNDISSISHEGDILSDKNQEIKYSNRDIQWNSLSTLNGSGYFGSTDDETICSAPSIDIPKKYLVKLKENHFSGDEHFEYPMKVDVLSKVCQFRAGRHVRSGAYDNRSFKLLLNNKNICDTEKDRDVELLILVKSTDTNLRARKTLRRFWLNKTCWGGHNVKHVFLLGTGKIQAAIQAESQEHGDIVQQDFIDNYYNNTLKMLLGLQWALSYCDNVSWLMFADDDYFVNPRRVMELVSGLDSRLQGYLLGGDLVANAKPIRGTRSQSKWATSWVDYHHRHYPQFVQAGAFILGPKLALDIYIASRFTKYFSFDDVFIGIILNKLLIMPSKINGILAYSDEISRDRRKVLAKHGIKRSLLSSMWRSSKASSYCLKKPERSKLKRNSL